MGFLNRRPTAGGIARHSDRRSFRDWLLGRGMKMEDAFARTQNRKSQRQFATAIGGGGTRNRISPRKRKKPSAHARHIARMKLRNQGGKPRV